MEKQYSVQFFSSFVEQLQDLCRNYFNFSQFVEVTGYISVEIDNLKKERYVLSELLQSSGNVVSESFCVKAAKNQDDSRQNLNTRQQQFVMRRPVECRVQRQQERQLCQRQESKLCQRQQERQLCQGQQERQLCQRQESKLCQRQQERQLCQGQQERQLCQYQSGARVTQSHQPPSRCSQLMELDVDTMNQRWQDSDTMINSPDIPISNLRNYSKEDSESNQAMKCEISKESSSLDNHFPTMSSSQSGATEHHPIAALPVSETDTLKEVSASLPNTVQASAPLNVKQEQKESSYVFEEIEVIDLDLFEDEPHAPLSPMDEASQGSATVPNECHPVPCRSQAASTRYSQKGPLKSGSRGIEHVIRYAVSQFRKYHIDRLGEDIDMVSLPPERLNALLLDFFQGVRKNDGGLPTVTTLKNLQSHLHRYLRDEGYPYSLVKDGRFQTCRQFIKMRAEDMLKSDQSPKYVQVTEDDIEIMFQAQQLGGHCLEALLSTMWVLNSRYLGLKRPSEHFNLKWGDVSLCQDDDGNEYLERRLENSVTFPIRVYAQTDNLDRCFVSLYKQYYERRPEQTTGSDYPFYLRYTRNISFKCEALSINQLGLIWRKIANESGLPLNKKIF